MQHVGERQAEGWWDDGEGYVGRDGKGSKKSQFRNAFADRILTN